MVEPKIVIVDPYHPVLGMFTSQIALRLIEQAGSTVTQGIMGRAWIQDPKVLMLAVLNEKHHIIGHAVATIDGDKAFLLQPRLDEPTTNDTTGELISLVDKWITEYNKKIEGSEVAIDGITLVAKRSDPKWAKKYDFETVRYVMYRKLKGE